MFYIIPPFFVKDTVSSGTPYICKYLPTIENFTLLSPPPYNKMNKKILIWIVRLVMERAVNFDLYVLGAAFSA